MTANKTKTKMKHCRNLRPKRCKGRCDKTVFFVIAASIMTIGVILLTIGLIRAARRQKVIDYLVRKYGDGGWTLVSEDQVSFTELDGFVRRNIKDGFMYVVTTSYADGGSFLIHLGDSDIVEEDYFLPTYYSYVYGFSYNGETAEYEELFKRMRLVTDYHYPYADWVNSVSHECYDEAKCRIFHISEAFDPISVQYKPVLSKKPDIIPDAGRIIELKEMISLIENFFSRERLQNTDENEDELYRLAFEEKVSMGKLISFVKNHITPVEGVETITNFDY